MITLLRDALSRIEEGTINRKRLQFTLFIHLTHSMDLPTTHSDCSLNRHLTTRLEPEVQAKDCVSSSLSTRGHSLSIVYIERSFVYTLTHYVYNGPIRSTIVLILWSLSYGPYYTVLSAGYFAKRDSRNASSLRDARRREPFPRSARSRRFAGNASSKVRILVCKLPYKHLLR